LVDTDPESPAGDCMPTATIFEDAERPNIDKLIPAGGKRLAVVADRSSGAAKDRRMHWSIAAVDPSAGDDVLAALDWAEVAAPTTQRRLCDELADVSKQRNCRIATALTSRFPA